MPFSESQVIVGPGSKGLIFAVQMAMSAELFLPSPSWVSYAPQAEMLGKRVRYIPSRVEDHYRIDLDAFDRMLGSSESRQNLLVVNSPNNPTGIMLEESFLEELAGFCRARNVIVMSDEIYFRVRGERPHRSIASFYPEGTIVLGGLSKHLSIGGWRLGVALLPDSPGGHALMDAVTAIASEIWSAVAAPVQHAAVVAYEGRPEIEAYTTTCSAIHGLRTKHLKNGLEALGVHCTAGDGAFYITANFDRWRETLAAKGVATSDDLAAYLLNEHGIATLPCSVFGLPPDVFSLRLTSSYLDMEKDSDGERILALYETSPAGLMDPQNHPNFAACLEEFGAFVSSLDD
jgi:aspartate/methionine/tyrosine aminotransferase